MANAAVALWGAGWATTPSTGVAGAEEVASLAAKHPDQPYLLFPEGRESPIHMMDALPER